MARKYAVLCGSPDYWVTEGCAIFPATMILLTHDMQVYIGACSIGVPSVNALSLTEWLQI